jgi:hypothetical protein
MAFGDLAMWRFGNLKNLAIAGFAHGLGRLSSGTSQGLDNRSIGSNPQIATSPHRQIAKS